MRVVAAATHAATVPPTPAERVTAVGAGMAAMLRRFGMPFMSRPTGLYTPNAAKESPVPASGSPHGVTAIADRVIAEGRKRVVVVSPEGDRASAATVRLLREGAGGQKQSEASVTGDPHHRVLHGFAGRVRFKGRMRRAPSDIGRARQKRSWRTRI